MTDRQPLVSVIIPTYNTAQYIVEAVESVLAQTYTNLEVLVIDDGSTDNTQQVLTPYLDRIQYIWQENQERAHTRNHGIRRARGELIAFLDSDDVWRTDKIALQASALEMYPQSVLAYGVALNVDKERHPVKFWGSQYLCGQIATTDNPTHKIEQPGGEILYGSPIIPSVVLVRRSTLDKVGLFDPQATPVEDWELWLRLARAGSFIFIPKVVCEYRAFGTERELNKRANDYYLERWLYVVDKTVTSDPQYYPSTLVAEVKGSLYTRSALASYELGDCTRGTAILSQAVQINPQLKDIRRFSYVLEDHVRRILDDSENPEQARNFLDTVLEHLPANAPQHIQSKTVLSRVYMARAFQAGVDQTQRRTLLWKGLRNDPSWFFNRGVWSLIIKSYLPE